MKKLILIAGPCAAEDKNQIAASLKNAQKRGVDFVRISLWKPRTKPGFEGIQEEGIPFMIEAARMGLSPATEVILPNHAQRVIETVLGAVPKARLMVWIGARNQNHYIQQEISRVASKYANVYLMVKNQPWVSLEHWEGIVEHVLAGGISKDRLTLCHRGFIPNGHNPHGYRNVPDYEMAMLVKKKYNLPMLFDPSHTGGSVENVVKIAKQASLHSFDGLIVEVHPNPKEAKTDAKQQLTWAQFDTLAKPRSKNDRPINKSSHSKTK